MTAIAERIRRDWAALSRDEKEILLEELQVGLDPGETDPWLTEAQKVELDRRLDDLRDNPDSGIPWAEAQKTIWTR